ncbi:MAG TPA: aldehyde dehydrogenase family protein, partial [Verrucomicrobiae bacterium]|nr:aldehyde dehydrogenase family protein [Verrucomicrobiae bacterium]
MTATLSPAPTPNAAIDRELAELRAGAAVWASLPVPQKIRLLEEVRQNAGRAALRWSEAAARAKGLTGTPLAGEETFSGPWALLRALNLYLATLHEIERTGRPQVDPKRVRVRPGGQVVVDVFPSDLYDRILLSGVRAEVWMQPGVTPGNLASTLGVWYQQEHPTPRVALVLGAGNIASIAPLDVLYKLLADGAVCMLKMNPVNDYLGPILEDVFAPLAEPGFLRFAYGGAETGKYLCAHEAVDEIHITGSDRTHDAIVFGDGSDAAQRKARNEPLLHKPITSELGNVSPTIVVPGAWSDADIRFQAEHIATQKMHNAGFNCIAAQVLILPAQWDCTRKLVAAVEEVLREIADRPAYYPGAAQRCERLAAGHGEVWQGGKSGDGYVARTVVRADPGNPGDPALDLEAFCSLLAVVELPGDPATYLANAVAFANERLWGTLGANLIVHPATMRERADELDRAIAELRYGCIGVNAWTGVGFLLCETTWGAYPGHTLDDVRSGIGVVHNTHLFSRAQKSVVYAPFAPYPRSLFGYGASLLPKPPWFVTNRNAAKTAQALCEF